MELSEFKKIVEIFTRPEIEAVNKPFLSKLEKYLEHEGLLLSTKQEEIEQLKADNQHYTKELSEKSKELEEISLKSGEANGNSEKLLDELKEKLKVSETVREEVAAHLRSEQAKSSDLDSRLAQLSREKESFRDTLTKKQDELSMLTSQIRALNEELLKFDKEKWQFRAREDEIQLKESHLVLRENQLKSKNALLLKQIQELQAEVDEKNVEILMKSRENSGELMRLREELAAVTDELKSKDEGLARAKMVTDKQSKTIDDLTERLRESVDFESQVKSALRQELNAQKRIADLHQDGQRVAEEKLKQATDGARELQKAVKEAVEKYGDLETRFEDAKLSHEQEIKAHKEVVAKLTEELKNANALLEERGATSGDLSLLTPAGAEVVKSGLSITQMYSEYASMSEKNALLMAENKHLKEYTEKIIREVDERIPMIRQQAFELQKEREENEDLRQQIAHAQTLVSRCRYEAEVSKSDAQFQKRQNGRMDLQIKDLQRQVVTLLKEVHQFKVGAQMAESPEDLGFDADMPQAQRLISEKFVTFRDIAELQENNQRLLATIRKLSEDSESAEAEAVAERTRELTAEVAKLKSQIHELGDSRQRSEDMVERLKKQYEVQRNLADSLNMSIQQRNEGDTSLVASKEGRISELTAEIREMRAQAELERSKHQEALSEQRREMQETINKLNEQSIELRVNAEKLTSLLEVEQEKFKKLQTSAESSKKENSALLEKNSALTGRLKAQDAQVAALKQDILSSQQKLKRAEVTVSQLQMDRQNLRENVQQLEHEVSTLRETSTHSALAQQLESLQSKLSERNASEVERLQSDLQRAQSECEIVRKDMSKHLSIFESSREEWRTRERELKNSVEGAGLRDSQLKNELNSAEQKVEELRRQLSEANEALKVQQRLAVPKSPHVSQPMSARFSTIQMELLEAKNQIEELNAEIERLLSQIKETENQRNQYHSTAESLERQLSEISQQMENSKNSLEKEIETQKAEIEKHRKEAEALRSSIHALNHEISRFESVKEEIRAERNKDLQKLENDLKASSVTIGFMNQREADAQSELKTLKATVAEKDKLYRDELLAHARSVEQMKALQEDFNELSARISAAEKTAFDAVSKHRLTEEKAAVDVQALEARLEELRGSNAELRKINDVLQEQVATLTEASQMEKDLNVSSSLDDEKSNQQLLEVIAFLRRDSNLLRAQLDRAEAENARLSAQIKQIQSQLTSSEGELKRDRGNVSRLLAPDHEELLRKIETMTSLQDSNRRLRDEIAVVREELEAGRKQFETAKNDVEPLQAKNKKLTEELDALNVECSVLRNEITRVKTQSNVFSRNIAERTRFQAEKESLEKNLREKETELSRARDSLNTALRQMEVAQRNFNQSKVSTEQLNGKMDQLNAKLEQQATELEQTVNAKLTLEQELSSVKAKLEAADGELTTVKAENDRLSKDLDKVTGTVNQLKALGRKYKREYEGVAAKCAELEGKQAEVKDVAVPLVKEEVKEEEGKAVDGSRRLTTAEVFSEPSTTTDQAKQDHDKITELETALAGVKEANQSLQGLSDTQKARLDEMNTENVEIKAKMAKLQEELNQAKSDAEEKDKLKSNIAELAIKNSSQLQQIDELSAEVDLFKAKLAKLEKDLADITAERDRLTAELQRTRDQKLSRSLPQEAPTANVKPMASPATQGQAASKGLAIHATRSTPSVPPTASIKPMAMQPRAVGQATPIVTSEVSPMTTSVSTHQVLVAPVQGEPRPTTPVVAMVPPTPSSEVPTSGTAITLNDGASTSRALSGEVEAQSAENVVAQSNQQRIKRLREPDSTPDDAAKKRTREDEPQEPVTQTSEGLQREAELRRTLAARRTIVPSSGGNMTVTIRSATVVQSTSSAVEDVIEVSSDSSVSEKDEIWDEINDDAGSYDEDQSGTDEEGSDEERSGEESGELSNDNEAALGDDSMGTGELVTEPENQPESSHGAAPSNSAEEMDEGVVPGTPVLVRPRGADAFAEAVVSPQQVPVGRFLFDSSSTDAQNPSVSRDIDATRMDLSQLEEPARAGSSTENVGEELDSSFVEEAFEDVAEVSTSGQEASAGDGSEQADSPVNGNDGGAVGPSSSRVTRAGRAANTTNPQARVQATRGGRTLRRPQQDLGSQEQASPSRGLGSGRARRSRGSK